MFTKLLVIQSLVCTSSNTSHGKGALDQSGRVTRPYGERWLGIELVQRATIRSLSVIINHWR